MWYKALFNRGRVWKSEFSHVFLSEPGEGVEIRYFPLIIILDIIHLLFHYNMYFGTFNEFFNCGNLFIRIMSISYCNSHCLYGSSYDL